MLLVGVDDTDSRTGGCTTALARHIPHVLGLTEAAPPRLVRLNPNVPWKTRGNGAICVTLEGHAELDDALSRVRKFVESQARTEDGTSPGVVVSRAPLEPSLYTATVTRIVERHEADAAIDAAGARSWGGRGVIGAAAALAWEPYRPRATWERIAYRANERVGTPRNVAAEALRGVELAFPTLFDTYDLVEDDVVCVPSSPCPVLWGLRGLDPNDLARASVAMGPERPAAETLFRTNHASDDHLVDRDAREVRAFESPRVRGRVAREPVERNGHVFIEVDGLRAAAYAPTRSFRSIVRALRPGDDITICGGAHDGPDGRLTVGIEKLCVHDAAPRRVGNPVCATCGRTMKSAGRNAGYRCCGNREMRPRTAAAALDGWHEVPASARRHLARPLRLDAIVPPAIAA